jgi:hypothetical protein
MCILLGDYAISGKEFMDARGNIEARELRNPSLEYVEA